MTRLEFHTLAGEKRARELAGLVDRLYRDGRRIVIWVADPGRLQILDDYLWTFEKLAFVPHAVWVDGGEMDEKVVLTAEPMDSHGADTLVVGDGLPPGEWIANFNEVHDLIPPGGTGDERREFWDRWRDEFGREETDG